MNEYWSNVGIGLVVLGALFSKFGFAAGIALITVPHEDHKWLGWALVPASAIVGVMAYAWLVTYA